MQDFAFLAGPFVIVPGPVFTKNAKAQQLYHVDYDGQRLGSEVLPVPSSRIDVLAALQGFLGECCAALADRTPLYLYQYTMIERAELSLQRTTALGKVLSTSSALPDIPSAWVGDVGVSWHINTASARAERTNAETYADLRDQFQSEPFAWVAGLLDDAVMTLDPTSWRAPTEFEIRHVVGEMSFTGVSAAAAAALVGVKPQSFRKYTARAGSATHQKLSFAMWHLLLHRIGVRWMRA